ncbi:MAG: DUF3365 domain-containing protein, partial [Verrucomicrobia bacterium]
ETVNGRRIMASFPTHSNQAEPPLRAPHEKGPWWVWLFPIAWTLLGVLVLGSFQQLREQTRNRLGLVATRQAIRRQFALERVFTESGGSYSLAPRSDESGDGRENGPAREAPNAAAVPRQPIHPSALGMVLSELTLANRMVVSRLVGGPDAPEPYRPDAWEAEGLAHLKEGNKEWSEAVPVGDGWHYRLMRGLVARPSCAHCHEDRQWAEGELVGAISVALDLEPLDHRLQNQASAERNVVAWVWMLGMAGYGAGMWHASTRRRQRLALWRQAEGERERFKGLFETAPISFWEEDFSEGRRRLQELQRSGVRHLRAHFDEHPEVLLELTRLLRVRAVNRTTLETFGARDEAELVASMARHFEGQGVEAFREIVLALAAGRKCVEQEASIPVRGEERTFLMRVALLPGAEETWDRVLVAFLDITERKRGIEVLERLATSYAHLSGADFFQAICRHVVDAAGVDAAFVGRLREDGTSVEVLAGWTPEGPTEPLNYELRGTPCENVIGGRLCVYPGEVQKHFPEDRFLVEWGIEAYVGSPVFDKAGKAIGLMVALKRSPLEEPERVERLFRLFLDRVSAEMQRCEYEAALIRRAEELKRVNEELVRFNRAAVGRELRMIELKREVNELCHLAGVPPRYALDKIESEGAVAATRDDVAKLEEP